VGAFGPDRTSHLPTCGSSCPPACIHSYILVVAIYLLVTGAFACEMCTLSTTIVVSSHVKHELTEVAGRG
jgi:hypothetical protein